MNDTIILIISMAVCLFGGIIAKYISQKYTNNFVTNNFFNATVSLSSALVLVFMSSSLTASIFTVILALAFGAVTGLQVITKQLALNEGSFAYTSVIISLSTLIPTLSGAVIWGEKISAIQILGIILMVICFVFSVESKKEEKSSSLKWFICCIAAFISTGLIGVMQKWHQSSEYKNELDAFLAISFMFSFAFSAFLVIWGSRKKIVKYEGEKKSVFALFPLVLMVAAGICAALNNKFNLYLSGVMDSAMLFPILNGGGMILNLIAALIIFREKLTLRQWIGIMVGTIAVVLLCIS